MSSIQKLNEYLGIDEQAFKTRKIFNPFIGIDSHLFLDPSLLEITTIDEFKDSTKRLKKYFSDTLRLLSLSKVKNDRAWKEVSSRLRFKETKGISIGYGESTSNGNAIGPELARKLTETAYEIVNLGLEDPIIFELLCLFEEDFGPDRLSDMVISIIREDVLNYTDRTIKEIQVDQKFIKDIKMGNKTYQVIKGPKGSSIRLLPEELLQDLPMALTKDEIGYVVFFNQELRRKVSSMLIGDIKLKDLKKKDYKSLLFNKSSLQELVKDYKDSTPEQYDFEKDPSGELKWYENGHKIAEAFPIEIELKKPKTIDNVNEIVKQIINQFKRSIESNELYELIYKDPISKRKPRHEKYSQRLFFSVADTYCKANNVVLSREPNAGNGPVDFKISEDYNTQVLVELKLSSGKVKHGFEKQLPEYQKNENAKKSFLVILRVTETYPQVEQIKKLAKEAEEEGKIVPEIIVIDAWPRLSASKN